MLTRRTLFKAAAALGALVASPLSIFSGRASAAVDSRSAGKDSPERHNELAVIAALEAREDVQDDLDIVELISRYVSFEEFEGRSTLLFGGCPLCHSWLRVDQEAQNFDCLRCRVEGTADAFYALTEGLSLAVSLNRLQGMLRRGELTGQPQFKRLCALYEDIATICHTTLMNVPTSHKAWQWLGEQGITSETVRRLQIGVMPEKQPHQRLRDELAAAGWDEPHLVSMGMIQAGFIQFPEQRIVIPVRDNQGRILAFSSATPGMEPHFSYHTVINQMRAVSPRRYDRLIFHLPAKGEGIDASSILLAKHAWDVVRLWHMGVPSVAKVQQDGWTVSQVRSAVKLGKRLIYAAPMKDICGPDMDRLMHRLGAYAEQLQVIALPDGLTAPDFVQEHGAKALAVLLEEAVPAVQLLRV